MQSLFKTWVTSHCIFIHLISRINHSRVVPHVVQPADPWLPVHLDSLSNLSIVSSQMSKYRVIACPAIRGSLRILLIVLQVQKLLVILIPKGYLSRSPYIACHNTAANHVHDIHYIL